MSDDQLRRFLAEMSVSANIAFACAAAGVTYQQATDAKRRDPTFDRRWREAARLARVAFVLRNRYPATR